MKRNTGGKGKSNVKNRNGNREFMCGTHVDNLPAVGVVLSDMGYPLLSPPKSIKLINKNKNNTIIKISSYFLNRPSPDFPAKQG